MIITNVLVDDSNRQISTLYQVFNAEGYPAGSECNPLALFDTLHRAYQWLDYLNKECGIDIGSCTLKEIRF